MCQQQLTITMHKHFKNCIKKLDELNDAISLNDSFVLRLGIGDDLLLRYLNMGGIGTEDHGEHCYDGALWQTTMFCEGAAKELAESLSVSHGVDVVSVRASDDYRMLRDCYQSMIDKIDMAV